ncbi:uncharacterized protein, partial [Cherax quadricarinatus]|uniref:uncharacterized protein n=1 Tax=Cherax quadricarinatus TaxID=27406 RepID=UPI00387EAA71
NFRPDIIFRKTSNSNFRFHDRGKTSEFLREIEKQREKKQEKNGKNRIKIGNREKNVLRSAGFLDGAISFSLYLSLPLSLFLSLSSSPSVPHLVHLVHLPIISQDVVQQITAGRRKREAEDDAKNEVFDFVYNGGLSALKEDLPQIVLPLMVDLMEASEVPSCMERPLCEANKALSIRHGVVGRVLASLISNVVGKAFTGDDHSKFRQVLEAASDGRSRHDCTVRSPGCFGRTSSPLGNNQRDD